MKKLLVIMVFVFGLHGCGGDSYPDISDAEVYLKKEFQRNEARTEGVLEPFTYEKVDGKIDKLSGEYLMYINVRSRTLKRAKCTDHLRPFIQACVIAKRFDAGFNNGGFTPGFFADVAISAPMIVTFEKRESGWVPVSVGKDSERDSVVTPSASVKERTNEEGGKKNEAISGNKNRKTLNATEKYHINLWIKRLNAEIDFHTKISDLLIKEAPEFKERFLNGRDYSIATSQLKIEKINYLLKNNPSRFNRYNGRIQSFTDTDEDENKLLKSNERYRNLKNKKNLLEKKMQKPLNEGKDARRISKIEETVEYQQLLKQFADTVKEIQIKSGADYIVTTNVGYSDIIGRWGDGGSGVIEFKNDKTLLVTGPVSRFSSRGLKKTNTTIETPGKYYLEEGKLFVTNIDYKYPDSIDFLLSGRKLKHGFYVSHKLRLGSTYTLVLLKSGSLGIGGDGYIRLQGK